MFLTTCSLNHHPHTSDFSSKRTAMERRNMKEPSRYMEMTNHSKSIKNAFPQSQLCQSYTMSSKTHWNAWMTFHSQSINLRNEDVRYFVQAELAEGTKIFANDGLFFTRMKDDEITKLDPVTNQQYPSLACASCATSDVLAICPVIKEFISTSEIHRANHGWGGELRTEIATSKKKKYL